MRALQSNVQYWIYKESVPASQNPTRRKRHSEVHRLKNMETKKIDAPCFTRPLFGLAPSSFLLGGVIEQYLDAWSLKQPQKVCEITKNLYKNDLQLTPTYNNTWIKRTG